ncbi:MAG: C39 family peptidase [Actinomycetota bacterium]|nr:C39 family peptidase [Actinomycetota bacterium]
MTKPRPTCLSSISASLVAFSVAVACGTAVVAGTPVSAAPAGSTAGTRHIAYRSWDGADALSAGRFDGTRIRRGTLRVENPAGVRSYAGIRYEFGRWTSPWVRPGFGLTEAVPSWRAATPAGTWLAVEMRGRTRAGRLSSWDGLGRWAAYDDGFRRRTLGAQTDDVTRVAVDTLQTQGRARLTSWQVRVTLYRRVGSAVSPRLRGVGSMVSALPDTADAATSRPGPARGVVLAVPRYSQMVHTGHYGQWGGGGEAWCSPTSTSMVLAYWDRGPAPSEYAWVPGGHPDPWVDHAARSVYDYGYRGAGNWAFNTAYASRYRTSSFVTRLRSLREAERFIAAGIPLVASISFGPGELDSAPIGSSAGHLLVIRGFTERGQVVVNDPAADTNREVRRVYRRDQFADAWIGGSNGVVYVVRPESVPLPRRTPEANW